MAQSVLAFKAKIKTHTIPSVACGRLYYRSTRRGSNEGEWTGYLLTAISGNPMQRYKLAGCVRTLRGLLARLSSGEQADGHTDRDHDAI